MVLKKLTSQIALAFFTVRPPLLPGEVHKLLVYNYAEFTQSAVQCMCIRKGVVPMRWLSLLWPEPVRRPMGPGRWPRFIGAGWQASLDDLYRELACLDPACFIFAARAAEHGALEIQFYAPPAVAERARTLVADTVAASREVCEQCGETGRLYGGPWLVTLCSSCAPR